MASFLPPAMPSAIHRWLPSPAGPGLRLIRRIVVLRLHLLAFCSVRFFRTGSEQLI